MSQVYKPKPIISLGYKEFQSGIATSVHAEGEGLFYTAPGVNVFVDPYAESVNLGLLQTYAAPIDITGNVGTSTIIAGAENVTGAVSGNLYGLTATGHFLSIDLSNDTVTDLRTSGFVIGTATASGVEIYRPPTSSATRYLYYWQTTQIGRWDLSAGNAGWTDNWATGLQSTTIHPTHQFAGAVWYGDLFQISKIYDNAGTATNSLGVLLFPSDYICTCLEDDGTYLIMGISKNYSGSAGSININSATKILFWDTFNAIANKEWLVPDFGINAIKRYENGFIAFCGRGMYYFDFNTKPKKLRMLTNNQTVQYGYPNSVALLNDAILFPGDDSGSTGGAISAYGKLVPTVPIAYTQPWAGLGNFAIGFMSSSKVSRLYVSTTQSKLYYYALGSGGATGVNAQTVYFDFKDIFQIDRMDVIFGIPLLSGDSFSIDVKTDETTAVMGWGTTTFVAGDTTRNLRQEMGNHLKTDQMSMVLKWNAGNVKIKRIDVYGERVSTI